MNLIETIENRTTALTIDDLAEMVSVSPKTLYKAVKQGRLPALRVLGSIRLDPYDVADWLRKRRTN